MRHRSCISKRHGNRQARDVDSLRAMDRMRSKHAEKKGPGIIHEPMHRVLAYASARDTQCFARGSRAPCWMVHDCLGESAHRTGKHAACTRAPTTRWTRKECMRHRSCISKRHGNRQARDVDSLRAMDRMRRKHVGKKGPGIMHEPHREEPERRAGHHMRAWV